MLTKFQPLIEITNPHRGVPIVMRPKRIKLGLLVGQSAVTASQAARTTSDTATGVSIGATVGTAVLPGFGTAIGAAVGAVVGVIGSLFGPAKEGQAAVTWDDMVNHGYLFSTRGQAFDERYIGEAYKGAMDKGNNVWPGCGKDGYKNPDCFYAPLAAVIAQGYLNKVVPLSASTAQVYSAVVLPWLQSGANGLITWSVLNNEPTQQLLIKAAVDRYIGGLPITRANMPAYTSQAANYAAWSTPSITVALASLLTPTPAAPASVAAAPPVVATAVAAPVVQVQPVATGVAQVASASINQAGSSTPTAINTPGALAPGYGYNYAGIALPIPPGYVLGPNGYILDAQGYIFGSANDDALTAAAPVVASNAVPSYGGQTPVVVQNTPAPVAATDNTLLYLGIAAVGLFLFMSQKK